MLRFSNLSHSPIKNISIAYHHCSSLSSFNKKANFFKSSKPTPHQHFFYFSKYFSTSNTNNKDKDKDKDNTTTMDWPKVSNEEWKQRLTPEQYHVAREKGTERPWSGKKFSLTSDFKCGCCKTLIFPYEAKFESGCGWPAFYQPIPGSVKEFADRSHGMVRTEVMCATCDAHLGHVFKDAPSQPTGLRYCINAVSLEQEETDK